MNHRSGFTLVELLLAVGMSSMILAVAFSAIRLTGQYCNLIGRMSTENTLLIGAVESALENRDAGNALPAPIYSTYGTVQNRPANWPTFGAAGSGNVDFLAKGQCPDRNDILMQDPIRGTTIELEFRVNSYK